MPCPTTIRLSRIHYFPEVTVSNSMVKYSKIGWVSIINKSKHQVCVEQVFLLYYEDVERYDEEEEAAGNTNNLQETRRGLQDIDDYVQTSDANIW
jgi:hypothetical protein